VINAIDQYVYFIFTEVMSSKFIKFRVI